MEFILIVWLSSGIVLLLLVDIVRFIYREKYAESIFKNLLKSPETSRERFLQYEQRMVRLLKISVWPVLLLFIMVPFVSFLLFREYFLVITIDVALGLIIIWHEYNFRKWLINYLKAGEP